MLLHTSPDSNLAVTNKCHVVVPWYTDDWATVSSIPIVNILLGAMVKGISSNFDASSLKLIPRSITRPRKQQQSGVLARRYGVKRFRVRFDVDRATNIVLGDPRWACVLQGAQRYTGQGKPLWMGKSLPPQ
jgi:hypothetical protein